MFKSQAPLATQEWLKTAHRCEVCWPLKDAIKFYSETRSYDRGQVDWRERTVPPYPRTSEQLAIEVHREHEPEPERVVDVTEFLGPASEYSLEVIVKRNKNGKINTQSTVGKVVDLALARGAELKVGGIWSAKGNEPYERNLWLQGAHHGLRFSVSGTTVIVNGALVPKEELLRRLEEIGSEA